MSHTYTANRLHVVFSTKNRRDLISPQLQPRLWAYMAEIGRNRSMHILAVGGIESRTRAVLAPARHAPGEGGPDAEGHLLEMDE